MATPSISSEIPARLRGAELVHPWIYPWFALAALVIGIPATVTRPLGTWLAALLAIVIVVTGATTMWMMMRRRPSSRLGTLKVLIAFLVIVSMAVLLAESLNPPESYWGDGISSKIDVPTSTVAFLALCMAIVWFLLWLLIALLVSGQRAYRSERNALHRINNRIHATARNLRESISEPSVAIEKTVVRELRIQAARITAMTTESSPVSQASLIAALTHIRDNVTSPALEKIADLSLTDTSKTELSNHGRVRLTGIPFRWNARYFSGVIGALIIGITTISASASIQFTSPGFLIQIPLIVLAFFLSVSASLFLFFAAALTPFLGPNSLAPENFVLFVVIGLLGLLSFLHRANEVRQVRALEGLSVANTELALETVRVRQQSATLQKSVVSLIHGKVQSALVAATVKIEGKKSVSVKDAHFVATTLTSAADELDRAIATDNTNMSVDFATSIAAIVELWAGSVNVRVTVSDEAEILLLGDRYATATTVEVISEATLNAAKHAKTTAVDASIVAEGNRIRVTVTNPHPPEGTRPISSTQVGLNFLRQLTSELRLDINSQSTSLVAEIPSRIEVRHTTFKNQTN